MSTPLPKPRRSAPRDPGRLVALVIAAAAVAGLVAAGCGSGGTLSTGPGQDGGGAASDGGGSGDGGGVTDGGSGADAGAHDGGGGTIDAGTPDAGISDAGTPDAGGGDGGVLDGGFGAPDHGYPSWRERAFLVLANAARMAPAAWRDGYMTDLSAAHATILGPATFPPEPPLHFSFQLAKAARFHSADLASTTGCAFQHDSCDGTAWATRVRTYDPTASLVGENITAGDPDPRRTLDYLLCDAPSSGAPCCADTDTACNGHRVNILAPGFKVSGTGFAQGTNQYTYYWTQDFADDAPPATGPVVAASHALMPVTQQFVPPDLGFFLNYADAAGAPQSVTLYLAGTAYPMTADLGPADQGTYVYVTGAGGSAAACRLYHFEAVDASGTTWRYPASGAFATAGVGACPADQDWVP